MIQLVENYRNFELIYSGKEQIRGLEYREGEPTKKKKETLGADRCVHYLAYSIGFTGVFLCQSSSNHTLLIGAACLM